MKEYEVYWKTHLLGCIEVNGKECNYTPVETINGLNIPLDPVLKEKYVGEIPPFFESRLKAFGTDKKIIGYQTDCYKLVQV